MNSLWCGFRVLRSSFTDCNPPGITVTVERWGMCMTQHVPLTPMFLLPESGEEGHEAQLSAGSQKGTHSWHLNCSCFLEPYLKIAQAQSADVLACVEVPKLKKDELFLDLYKQLRRKSPSQQHQWLRLMISLSQTYALKIKQKSICNTDCHSDVYWCGLLLLYTQEVQQMLYHFGLTTKTRVRSFPPNWSPWLWNQVWKP